MRKTTRGLRALVAVLVIGLIAAACGDDSSDDANQPSGGGSESTAGSGDARPGGVLNVGVYLQISSFDPLTPFGTHACCGGNEMMALYDILVSFDHGTGEYEGRLAESIEPNDDHTVWTLKLRPDVKFSDGTTLDADAVKLNVERHLLPESRSLSKPLLVRFGVTTKVIDPLTVEFTLNQAWVGFPSLLAREVGMIASPTAIEKAGKDFATNPGAAGAGPFTLTSYRPGESVEMAKNPNYWGGEVLLDGLRFATFGSEELNAEAVARGELDVAYTRNQEVIQRAENAGTTSFTLGLNPMGYGLAMNSGAEVTCNAGEPALHCGGKPDGTKVQMESPTSDLRVRQAVAAAIDLDVLNQRVYGGAANMNSAFFPDELSWSPGVAGPEHDPDEARRLVESAKADGWDGNIRLLVPNSDANTGIALKTMLDSVGMDVQVDSSGDAGAVTRKVSVERDFDLARYSFAFSDELQSNYVLLTRFIDPARFGWSSAEFADGLDTLRVATSEEQRGEALEKIAAALANESPLLSFYIGENKLLVGDHVKGVDRENEDRVPFETVWLDR